MLTEIAARLREIIELIEATEPEPSEPGGETGLDDYGVMAKSVLTEYTRYIARHDGHKEGDVWDPENIPTFGYPTGWTIQHPAGTEWVSTVSGNVWEPGIANWRRITTEGEIAPWVQPTGATDAYQLGDQVLYDGATWTSTVANNVWRPDEYGWTKN